MMARGDDGKTVFENDDNRLVFLERLGEACGSLGEEAFRDRLLVPIDET